MKITLDKNIKFYACQREGKEIFVVSSVSQPKRFHGCERLWTIDVKNNASALYKASEYTVKTKRNCYEIEFSGDVEKKEINGLPSCDFLGNAIELDIDGSNDFQQAVLKFYWFHILPECAERTFMRKSKKWRDGYVLSTLQLSKYAGTYPAVDHEFHIRGKMAIGGGFELQLIRRMLELQIRTMVTDKSGKNRIPCSVQPNGKREYRVMRKSMNKRVKAQMFTVTGITELCEELYNYYLLTKDIDFVKKNIKYIENGLEFLILLIDKNGRLSADVYYEDQVMKHGATAQAQAFAINSLNLMARLENLIGNSKNADRYAELSSRMRANYIMPIPQGYWDCKNERYIDWIDIDGKIHDHIHLLSNALSVTYNFNDKSRNEQIKKIITKNDNIFQKFPSFVAAKIEDYDDFEIGNGGPYDLCAAGRYWCHDAKYRRAIGDSKTIKAQLEAVKKQAEIDNFDMGERYDMNYVYYNKGADAEKNWHGVSKYYEYPNVFTDVLIHDYFGVLPSENANIKIAPCLSDSVHFKMEGFGIEYTYNGDEFEAKNISEEPLKIELDLSYLFKNEATKIIILESGEAFKTTK